MAGFLVLAALVWALLLPALAWGKCAIPAPELRRLLGRAAGLSLGIGLPLVFGAGVLFGRMNPDRTTLGELLGRAGLLALAFLPFSGALVTTSVFQARHAQGLARDEGRPAGVRIASGALILAANLLASLAMLFTLFAVSGAYRGWR